MEEMAAASACERWISSLEPITNYTSLVELCQVSYGCQCFRLVLFVPLSVFLVKLVQRASYVRGNWLLDKCNG